MKNIIIQIDIDVSKVTANHKSVTDRVRNEPFIKACRSSVEDYAELVGSDYYCYEEPRRPDLNPQMEIFRVFDEDWLEEYDNVLILDNDILVQDSSPNIFEFSKHNTFTVAKRPLPHRATFNSGMVMVDREARRFVGENYSLERAINLYRSRDQEELIHVSEMDGVNTQYIGYEWNDYTFKNTSYFHHHKGKARLKK